MRIHPDWPRPGDVLLYYQRASHAFRALPKLIDDLSGDPGPFFKMSREELRDASAAMTGELKLQSVLLLAASLEATFQVDLRTRAGRKLNDHFSTALRRLEKQAKKLNRRVEVEDILDIWRSETGLAKPIGELKQVIAFRHWLAHGRYWTQKSGLKDLDPLGAWSRWEAVRDGIGNMTSFPLEPK